MSGPMTSPMHDLELVCSSHFPIHLYSEELSRESITVIPEGAGGRVLSPLAVRVLLVDEAEPSARGDQLSAMDAMIRVGVRKSPQADGTGAHVTIDLPPEPSVTALLDALRSAYDRVKERKRAAELEQELQQRNHEIEAISRIGVALQTVRNHNELLGLILSKSRELSRSDAGSLYLIDDSPDGKVLRWKLAQNDSIPVNFQEKVLPITRKSLAGCVALTGETLVIDDAYNLPPDAEYTINRSFDEENGYLTRSMLVFPMRTHNGEIIGVLQLINRKKSGAPDVLTAADVAEQVIPFDDHAIRLMQSLAGQAAVALENNHLYKSIERLFEGFVTASVTAIEQRDPTTSGHSFRVAELTVGLARTVDRLDRGVLAPITFTAEQLREIRYASLLHDFGKVGVRENILVKEKKLYPLELAVIRGRFDYMIKSVEADFQQRRIDYLLSRGSEGYADAAARLDEEMAGEIASLRDALEVILRSNEPSILPDGNFITIQELSTRLMVTPDGARVPILSASEVQTLSIRKGNLDPEERSEIESHVTHTFSFLSKIPWTKDLLAVPDIAYAHHEKMNGRGYPRGLAAVEIPLQARMMTIADIYDALTAKDRPYKRAVPVERALDILRMEVGDGLLDPLLVDLFINAKIYEREDAAAS
jgi:HD-GYP domain-containing protein (c-di-GMP phosphodiesterase class II)